MRKRLVVIGLLVLMILQLVSCAAEPKEKDPIQEFIENKTGQDSEFVAYGKDEEEMKDPLVICMDLEYVRNPLAEVNVILNEFLNTLEQSGGLSDVVIEYIPKHGADREGMLDRIRVELMTGGGPDVFIANCAGTNAHLYGTETPLFPFPEKVMESGIFLPLDEYMENNAQYAEWDKQTQAVLAAGRNREGQQLIPLTYTLPVLCYRKSDVEFTPTKENMTWSDVLNDPELCELARPIMDMADAHIFEGELLWGMIMGRTEYLFGDLADFENEELLLTEEEILQRVQEIHTLREITLEKAPDGYEKYPCVVVELGWDLAASGRLIIDLVGDDQVENIGGNEPLTMVPIYSDDGGVTASILSFAAVNRNTQRPEDAYIVIDLLMRDFVQRKYSLYSELLTSLQDVGISMHEDLMREDTSVGGKGEWYLTDQRYEELSKVRNQITAANFKSELDYLLNEMLSDCWLVYHEKGTEEDLKEVIAEYYDIMQRMVRE